jgi:hypothetical protein
MDWLEVHNPMQCDWKNKKMSFDHKGTQVTLQGVLPQHTNTISEIPGEQVFKL